MTGIVATIKVSISDVIVILLLFEVDQAYRHGCMPL